MKQFYYIEKHPSKEEYYLKNVGTGKYIYIEDNDSKEHLRQYPEDPNRGKGEPFIIDRLSYHTMSYYKSSNDPGWIAPEQFNIANAWMKDLPDNAVISTVNIPATHDTACSNPTLSIETKTQKYTYEQQLNIGTRMFDVRIEGRSDGLWLNHGGLSCYDPLGTEYNFNDFAKQTIQFLDENPSETVFWVLKHESGTEELTSLGIVKLLENSDFYNHVFIPEESYAEGAPLVSDVRGKVVLLVRRYSLDIKSVQDEIYDWNKEHPDRPITEEMFGYPILDWDNFPYSDNYQAIKAYDRNGAKVYIQDKYNIIAEYKWDYVEGTMAQTTMGQTNNPNGQDIVKIEDNGWVFNYTSCTIPVVSEPHYTSQLINTNLFTDTKYINNKFLGDLFYNYIDGMLARQIIDTNFAQGADFIKIHNHSPQWVTDSEATLESDGSKHKECLTCHKTLETVVIPKIAEVKLSQESAVYDGNAIEPDLIVKDSEGNDLIKDIDYSVTVPDGRSDAGEYTYDVVFKGNYSGATSLVLKIIPVDTAVVKISTKVYTYNGKVKNPAITVKDAEGNDLVKDKDYTVIVPKGRKNVGKYTYKVNFIGNYKGSKAVSFTIKPAAAVIKSLTSGKGKLAVKATSKPSVKGGTYYQISYRQKGTSKWKTVTTKTYYKTIGKLKKGKYYYVKVRACKKVGTTIYRGNWSKTKLSKKIK